MVATVFCHSNYYWLLSSIKEWLVRHRGLFGIFIFSNIENAAGKSSGIPLTTEEEQEETQMLFTVNGEVLGVAGRLILLLCYKTSICNNKLYNE